MAGQRRCSSLSLSRLQTLLVGVYEQQLLKSCLRGFPFEFLLLNKESYVALFLGHVKWRIRVALVGLKGALSRREVPVGKGGQILVGSFG